MSKILLTGGTGFVGSHLVEKAQKNGDEVYVLVRKSSDTTHLKSLGIRCLEAGMTDTVALENVLTQLTKEGIKLDAVVHCAALTKANDWATFEKVNVTATENFIQLLQKYQPDLPRFIFISSLAAAGPTELGNEISASHKNPITNYGKSKAAAELVVKKSGIPYTIIRPTAVYGPREKEIFTLFQIINRGFFPLIGSNLQALTFVYVKDLVSIILKAVELPAAQKAYFVTDGNVYNKADLGEYIKKYLNKSSVRFTIPLGVVRGLAFVSQTFSKSAPLNLEKYKELKASSWNCNVKDTFTDFDYKPAYNLDEGVKETVAWYRAENWL